MGRRSWIVNVIWQQDPGPGTKHITKTISHSASAHQRLLTHFQEILWSLTKVYNISILTYGARTRISRPLTLLKMSVSTNVRLQLDHSFEGEDITEC